MEPQRSNAELFVVAGGERNPYAHTSYGSFISWPLRESGCQIHCGEILSVPQALDQIPPEILRLAPLLPWASTQMPETLHGDLVTNTDPFCNRVLLRYYLSASCLAAICSLSPAQTSIISSRAGFLSSRP